MFFLVTFFEIGVTMQFENLNLSFTDVFRVFHKFLGSDLSMTDFFREFLDMITTMSPDWRLENELSSSLSPSVCKKYIFRGFSKRFARIVLKRLDTSPLLFHLSSLSSNEISEIFSILHLDNFSHDVYVLVNLVVFLISKMADISFNDFSKVPSKRVFNECCSLCCFVKDFSFSFCSCCYTF